MAVLSATGLTLKFYGGLAGLSILGLTIWSFGCSECNRVNSGVLAILSAIGLTLWSFGYSECNKVKFPYLYRLCESTDVTCLLFSLSKYMYLGIFYKRNFENVHMYICLSENPSLFDYTLRTLTDRLCGVDLIMFSICPLTLMHTERPLSFGCSEHNCTQKG